MTVPAQTAYGPTHWLRTHARHRPGTVAVIDGGAGVTLTFAELHDRVRRMAAALRGLGLQAGDRLAVLADDSHHGLELVLAGVQSAMPLVPLNVRLSEEELARNLAAARPRVLFTDARHAGVAARALEAAALDAPAFVFGAGPGEHTSEALLATAPEGEDRSLAAPGNLAVVAFTSGTTGAPKLVAQPLRMLADLAITKVVAQGLTAGEYVYSASPMFHISGMASLLTGIAIGHLSLILPQFDPAEVLRRLREDGLTTCFLVPTMIAAVLNVPAEAGCAPALRTLVYGAAPMPPALLRRAAEVFGCDFIQLFGAGTEAGLQCLLTREDHRRALAGEPGLLGSVGRPAFGVELRICDGEDRDVPAGAVGRILTRSGTQMDGYLTAEGELEPLERDGWLHGGDLGRLDEDGYVHLAGRSRDLIVRGGENIFPIEVEAVLAEHPGVAQAAVVGVPDARWGEAVHAFLVCRTAPLSLEQVRAHCRSRLASYKVPVKVHVLPDLPRNAAGKVLKARLVELAAEQEHS